MRHRLLIAVLMLGLFPISGYADQVSKIVETHIDNIRQQLSDANVYSMLVVTKLLKRAGASYQPTWLAPTNIAISYPRGDELRVMVGVYQFDSLYSAAFDKRNATQKYLKTQAHLSRRMRLKNRMEMAAVFPPSLNRMLQNPRIMSLDNALDAYATNARKYRLLVSKPLGLSTVESGLFGFVLEGLHIVGQTLMLQPDKQATLEFLETKIENPGYDLETVSLMYSMQHSLNMAIDVYSSFDTKAKQEASELNPSERGRRLEFFHQMRNLLNELQTDPTPELIEKLITAVKQEREPLLSAASH